VTAKDITTMTDADIEALSDEELAELTAEQGGAEEEGEEEEETEGEEEETEEETEEEEETEDPDPNAGLTAEEIAALAKDGDLPGGKSRVVPHTRFNEVNEENKDLRLLLKMALAKGDVAPAAVVKEEPAPVRPVYDFKVAQREYHKLISEGEDDKAGLKLDEIEDKREELQQFDLTNIRTQARREAVAEVNQTQAQREVGAVIKDLHERYPFLNENGKAPEEAAILAVNAKAKQLIAQGQSPAEALIAAGESIGPRFAKVLGIAPTKPGKKAVTPLVDGKDPRSKDALKRNLGLRQPPTGKSGVGTREQMRTLDISKMTDAQIDKLTPAELAEATGANHVPT
jgi:hypothetical protein